MKRLITICLVVGIILAVCVPAQATLLSDLLVPGATITSGDKLFSNFQNWAVEGGNVNAADVTVSAYQNLINLEYGLEFTSGALKLDSAGGLNVSFDYIVQSTLPGYLISDNTLTSMGTAGSGGIWILEYAKDAEDETKTLASKLNTLQETFEITTAHVVYTNPVVAVHVYTEINLSWEGGAAAGPSLTEFTQTFSQVPEPATITLLGLAGVIMLRRRRG